MGEKTVILKTQKDKKTKTHEVDGRKGGLIPMMMADEPPVSQLKIDAERNESKEQFNVATRQKSLRKR